MKLISEKTFRSSRRRFVTGAGLGMAATAMPVSRLFAAGQNPSVPTIQGQNFVLDIGYQNVNFTGKNRLATTINNSLPAPTLRWKEGETGFACS